MRLLTKTTDAEKTQNRRYYEGHRQQVREYQRAYRSAHLQELTAKQLARRSLQREELAGKARTYYAAHKDEVKEHRRQVRRLAWIEKLICPECHAGAPSSPTPGIFSTPSEVETHVMNVHQQSTMVRTPPKVAMVRCARCGTECPDDNDHYYCFRCGSRTFAPLVNVVRKRQAASQGPAIVAYLQAHPMASVREVVDLFKVSDTTVRKYRQTSLGAAIKPVPKPVARPLQDAVAKYIKEHGDDTPSNIARALGNGSRKSVGTARLTVLARLNGNGHSQEHVVLARDDGPVVPIIRDDPVFAAEWEQEKAKRERMVWPTPLHA